MILLILHILHHVYVSSTREAINYKLLDAVSFYLLFSQVLVCYIESVNGNGRTAVSYKRHQKLVHTFSHFVAFGPKYIQKLFKRVMLVNAQKKLGSKLIFLSGLPQPGSDCCGLRPHTFNI